MHQSLKRVAYSLNILIFSKLPITKRGHPIPLFIKIFLQCLRTLASEHVLCALGTQVTQFLIELTLQTHIAQREVFELKFKVHIAHAHKQMSKILW